ncbi:MAG: anti-sigma factor [Chloroflexi bacterium]|nr:anti-sigma factor [Chloroflexota bacterium]
MNERSKACDELRDLLAAYAIGAADDDEVKRIEAGLSDCPGLADSWASLRGLDGDLAAHVAQVAPPPHLLGSVLEAARTSRRRSRGGLGWAAAAAAVLLLIVTNVFWMSRPPAPELREVNLPTAAEGEATGATGRVIWTAGEGEAVLIAQNFPELTPDAAYQAWVRRGETLTSLGVFRVDDTGRGALTFDATLLGDSFDILGVTREPLGGSPGPTSGPVVRWQSRSRAEGEG